MDSQFEQLGFFEEIWEDIYGASPKCHGTRRCEEQPGREIGMKGDQSFTIRETLTVTRGHKTRTINASAYQPRILTSRYQRLCGRTVANIHTT
jgi:hypothetical protein